MNRYQVRSRTFHGVAVAMAGQWTDNMYENTI